MTEQSGEHSFQRSFAGGPIVDRRTFLGTVGASAGLTSLSGCVGVFADDRPELSIITDPRTYEYPDMREIIAEEAEVELSVSTSNSPRIARLWDEGRHDEWDLAIFRGRHATEVLESGGTLPLEGEVPNMHDMQPIFSDIRDAELAVNGEVQALPLDLDWYGYGFDSRELGGHEHAWNSLFSTEIDGVDITERIAMSEDYWPSMAAIAFHLGYLDSLQSDPIAFTDEELDQIYETAMEQQEIVYNYVPHTFRGWMNDAEGSLVALQDLSDVIELHAEWGVDWPDMALPEHTMVEYHIVVVSAGTEEPEAAWRTADVLAGPRVGAGVARYGRRIGANQHLGDHLDDFIDQDTGRFDIGFEPEAAEFVRDLELPDFDQVLLRRLIDDEQDDVLEDMWDDVTDEFLPPDAA